MKKKGRESVQNTSYLAEDFYNLSFTVELKKYMVQITTSKVVTLGIIKVFKL